MRARLLLTGLLLLLPAAPATQAQDGSSVYSVNRAGNNNAGPLQWFFGSRPDARVLRVNPAPRRAYAPRARASEQRRRTVVAPPADANRGPETVDPTLADPEVAITPSPGGAPTVLAPPPAPQMPPVSVGVIGDSLSVHLAQGLQDTYGEQAHVTFVRRHREASGLVRDDYYDWPKQLRDLIATTPKLDAVLIQIGSNDRQHLRDDAGAYEPLSQRWREIYFKRIDEIAAIAREKRIPLIWVGLPSMRGERMNTDIIAINTMFRARAAQNGITFIDVWEAFTGDDGAYVVNGPDVDGTIVRLRTADGVHFTKAGARKLAFFADKELRKVIASVQERTTGPAQALAPAPLAPAPISGSAALTLGLPNLPEPALPAALQSTDALLGIPLPDAPLPPPLTARPMQGPVVSLNTPPVATGGLLVGGKVPAPADADLFRGGLSSDSKLGRADDFRLR